MKHTETHFGLENHSGKITADNGETYLKPFQEMSVEDFEGLVVDIEHWKEASLNSDEIQDLKEILDV